MAKTRTSKMKVKHRRIYLRLSPTESFKRWKYLRRLNHIEGEDGQVCAFLGVHLWSGLIWSGLDQYWMKQDGSVIPEQLVFKITT